MLAGLLSRSVVRGGGIGSDFALVMGCVRERKMWLRVNKKPEDRRRDLKIHTSGIPAACSHESSFGLCKSMLVETEIYSAYAPVFHAIFSPELISMLTV